MRPNIVLWLACGTAALAACSKPPASNTAAAPQVHAPVAPPASTAGFLRPHPKVGLWRMSMSSDNGPGVSMTGEMCIDAKTEASAFEANPRAHASNCSAPHFSSNPGGGMIFDSTCKVGDRTISSHGVATGDFSNSYVLDVSTRIDPPLPGVSGIGHSRVEAHWIGPCKPGQRPGQMTGLKIGGFGRG